MTDRRGGCHKSGGHSSASGRIASANAGVHAATKFGITAFSESLRQEVTTRGVRVVVIEPGFVATELTGHNTDPTMRAAAQNMAASMRTLQPEDIANAVLRGRHRHPRVTSSRRADLGAQVRDVIDGLTRLLVAPLLRRRHLA